MHKHAEFRSLLIIATFYYQTISLEINLMEGENFIRGGGGLNRRGGGSLSGGVRPGSGSLSGGLSDDE